MKQPSHFHRCDAEDCEQIVECWDDCVEGEQETFVFCPGHDMDTLQTEEYHGRDRQL
jgi:hypothetical protein